MAQPAQYLPGAGVLSGLRERVDHPARGIAYTVLGMGFITVNDAAMKWVVSDYPIGQAIFIRGLFTLLAISFLVRRAGGFSVLKWNSAFAQLSAGVLLVIPLFIFIYSISQLPLSLATIEYGTILMSF